MGCFGWLVDLAVSFTGSAAQQLPIVNPESLQWSTGNATYDDLRLLIRELRTAAVARGMPKLKLGVLFTGWATLYNLVSNFSRAHPEIYINNGANLAHGLAWHMKGDAYPYAAYPNGVQDGQSWFELFGQQWAYLSAFLSLDVVILRDGLSGSRTMGGRAPLATRHRLTPL
jgi:hypothetical protein